MALDKAALKQDILDMLTDMSGRVEDPEQARFDFAEQLSTAIDAFVKTGQVNVTVNTTGTASAQTGTGTGSVT